MHRTKLHRKLALIAGGAAKTGQSSTVLVRKIDHLERAVKDSELIQRLNNVLAGLEEVLAEEKKKRTSRP